MRCKGTYRSSFFHNWGKWQNAEATWISPLFKNSWASVIQFRDCGRCGKRKIRKLA